ncbi:hypothetical protein DV735_g4530, partial [Chaetothyriales sp. CBS 134920]
MTKAAVPQYPRPVPLTSTDEAPVLPNTIVYHDDDSDDADEAEQEERQRAAKRRRRRVADAAASYLRGEQLFILTASLNGPFDKGWKNPWARKRQKRGEGHAHGTAAETAVPHKTSEREHKEHKEQAAPKQRRRQRQHRSGSRLESESRSSAKKVPDWLRTTEDLAPPVAAENGLLSSPTPGARERWELPPHQHEQRPLSPSEYESAVSRRADDNDGAASAHASTAAAAFGRQPFSFSISDESQESQRRAEAAILEYKRSIGRPVARLPRLSESESESRRLGLNGSNQRKRVSEQDSTSNGPSTAAHSAQVVARLATLPSDLHSTEEMLQSAPLPTPTENNSTSHPPVHPRFIDLEKENSLSDKAQFHDQENKEPQDLLENSPQTTTPRLKPTIDLHTATLKNKKPLNQT